MESVQQRKVTPLRPKEFFRGVWRGEGEMVARPFLAWLAPKEHVSFESHATWFSDTVWMVKETFNFSSGTVMPRTMFLEIMGPDRLHVTADDMPLGADIILTENSFTFTPYYMWGKHRGRYWRMKCIDKNIINESGIIYDTIKIYYLGIHVATMYLTVTVDRNAE